MILRMISVLTLTCAVLVAQPLAQGDRDYAASQLHATRKLFLDTAASVSDKQWNFKPAPDVWSLAEIAEHVALAEQAFFQKATIDVMKNSLDAEKKGKLSNRQKDDLIVKTLPVRDQKVQTQEALKPTGRFKSRQEVVTAFRARRDATIAYILSTNDELRGHFAPTPMFGDLDAYQWLIMMSAHTERHVNQMKEVMARPDFPKK